MKNFVNAIKSSLNNVFPNAGFTDETTESEVVDFLETQEGTIKAEVEEIKETTETLEEKGAASEEAVVKLGEAIKLMADNQKAQSDKIDALQSTVNKISAGSKNLPADLSGDDAPAAAVDGDDNVFQIGKRSDQVLEHVKTAVAK